MLNVVNEVKGGAYLRRKKSGKILFVRVSDTIYHNCQCVELRYPERRAYIELGPLLVGRLGRLSRGQRRLDELLPLLRRPQHPRVRPIQDSVQLLVRILNRRTRQAKPQFASELMESLGSLRGEILEFVRLVHEDTTPGKGIQLLDIAAD